MSIASRQKAQNCPGAMALADERQTLTWAQLDDVLNRAANALLDMDLGRDKRVAVYAENSAETVIAHLAAITVGVSTVPVNFHLTAAEVAYILRDSGAAALFVGPENAETGVKAATDVGVAAVIGWRCDAEPPLVRWDDWLGDAASTEPPSDMPPKPFLHYTSGTTGRPKATETPPQSFPGGTSVAEHFDRLVSPAADGPALVVSPLYHTGTLGFVRVLGTGTPLVVLGRFDAERTLWAIDTFGVATTMMVPTHFQRLLKLPTEIRNKYDTSTLQQVAHTGAACPVDVKRRMIEWLGPVLVEAYGATESGTTNAITSQEWLEHPGSVGKTLPPFELLVVDDDGRELGPKEVGQLYFRDTTGRGIVYANDPDKTRAAHLAPGVFTLGEMGYHDEDGYLYITDRVSDMVVSGGVNIYPAETELVLLEHPAVGDVAVIGVPNPEMGEELKALIVPSNLDDPPATEELDRYCRERLAGYKRPRSYDIVDDIGRNSMGKVNKRLLRAPYWPTDRTIG
ncbi:AMP-binding protein [Mycobacterium sp. OAE908]|uniref:AMP-binding protein n=1 Tax=Mycobacterium sp. OAE908 TaxID=2817899 RepID=UPI001AE52D61